MAGTFDLELVSPEKLILSRPVEMATIPAAEGEMGVLPGHSPMIVALRGGVIRVRENGQETERLFVMGGFAEVTPTRVTVLAEEATPVADLSRAEAERRLAEAEAALNGLSEPTPAATEAAMARVAAARAMVQAAGAA
ncbi:ATP synthase F1 subunit epsilon [Roseomonas sp. CCTCC AB2023176]|uniref:ATP synthase F1 subunit epsilon n=1 Tax=Roseomonas sp. CCTCC AB2023176 TaxID=3342640 RepID=UPI0035DB1E94